MKCQPIAIYEAFLALEPNKLNKNYAHIQLLNTQYLVMISDGLKELFFHVMHAELFMGERR